MHSCNSCLFCFENWIGSFDFGLNESKNVREFFQFGQGIQGKG